MFGFFSNTTRCIGGCTAYLALSAGSQIMNNATSVLESCGLYPTNSTFNINGLPVTDFCSGAIQAVDISNFLSGCVTSTLEQLCNVDQGSELSTVELINRVAMVVGCVGIVVAGCIIGCHGPEQEENTASTATSKVTPEPETELESVSIAAP